MPKRYPWRVFLYLRVFLNQLFKHAFFLIECRHIFRTGKYQHSDEILNFPWTYRVAAWGTIKLLENDETCTNEVVFYVDPTNTPMIQWLG